MPDCSVSGGVTGYPCTKFHSADETQWQARNTSYDWFIYRYAEVLLINAEANAELGTCTQDVLDKTINQLRASVDMAHLTVAPVAAQKPINYGYALSNLLYEIRRERRIELVGEGFRMDDLKRWNAMKLLENPLTTLGIRVTDKVKEQYNEIYAFDSSNTRVYNGKTYLRIYAESYDDAAGRKWSDNDRRWLYPLPIDQLALNKNLTQNPGWTE